MNRRLTTILLLAFIVAAGSSFLVYRVAGQQMGAKGPSSVKIIVAARDLEIGTLISDADVTFGDWVGALPKSAVQQKDKVLGRGVVSALYQGEPILDSRLAAAGSGGGLAATIRPGMRACAIKVDEVVGVAGFVLPGMRVDVLISGSTPGAPPTEGPKVKTLLQDIEVLSAGTNIQKDKEGKPVQVQVVNLLVDPDQAQLLSLASNETKIQLVLRNPLDNDKATPKAVAMASLFADPNAPAARITGAPVARPAAPRLEKQAPPQTYTVEVINGSKRTEEKFAQAEPKQ